MRYVRSPAEIDEGSVPVYRGGGTVGDFVLDDMLLVRIGLEHLQPGYMLTVIVRNKTDQLTDPLWRESDAGRPASLLRCC